MVHNRVLNKVFKKFRFPKLLWFLNAPQLLPCCKILKGLQFIIEIGLLEKRKLWVSLFKIQFNFLSLYWQWQCFGWQWKKGIGNKKRLIESIRSAKNNAGRNYHKACKCGNEPICKALVDRKRFILLIKVLHSRVQDKSYERDAYAGISSRGYLNFYLTVYIWFN